VVIRLRPHEVLIRTAACGLCRSDLHFVDGAYPHPLPTIPGHEAAGIVEAVGSEVRTVKVGDAVVTCLSAFCGHCEFCVTGRMSLCMGGDTRRAGRIGTALITRPDGAPVNQMLNLSAFAETMLSTNMPASRSTPRCRSTAPRSSAAR
jgi:S-(hydroxymethyl)glutathione dehydrogenase/alcohol dehydrogenase